MTSQHPTPDDLRTIAANLTAEGQTSRAEVLNNAADLLDVAIEVIEEYTPFTRKAIVTGLHNRLDMKRGVK
jgi:hypothetical protein